jgi:hypothetical protein
MKRRFRKHNARGRSGAWLAGVGLVLGAAAVLTLGATLPSARRYLRLRAM